MKKLISVTTGTYNEEDNIEEWVRRVLAVAEAFPNYDFEIIVIDNCSEDKTQEKIRQLAKDDPRIKAIFNSRNFGHIRSAYHALMEASGDAVVGMASDLQDPPELITDLIRHWENGAKSVVCVKESSDESLLFHYVRKFYYQLVYRLAETKIIKNTTGFGLYDRAVMDYCRKVADPYPYFRGQISDIGLEIKEVTYRQPMRKRGITKNNFFTLYDLAMLGITNHSKVPLRLAAMLGFVTALLSLLVAFGYFVYKLLFWQNFPVGTAPVVIGLFFFASVQLCFIGILGEYIGAIHTQIMNRPLVVERERLNF